MFCQAISAGSWKVFFLLLIFQADVSTTCEHLTVIDGLEGEYLQQLRDPGLTIHVVLQKIRELQAVSQPRAPGAKDAGAKDSASSAKDYLEQHLGDKGDVRWVLTIKHGD